MIPRLALPLLLAALAPFSRADDQPSVASQSLARLKTEHKYEPSKTADNDSPGVGDLPPIQMQAFTIVESMHARDLDTAMRGEAHKVESQKHTFLNAHDLASVDLGPVRASVRFEAVPGNGIHLNLLQLSW